MKLLMRSTSHLWVLIIKTLLENGALLRREGIIFIDDDDDDGDVDES